MRLCGIALLVPASGLAQIAAPGDMDPAGRVYLEVVARVGAAGTNSPLIPGMTIYVVSENGHRVTMKTTLAGTAATWLTRARYRIVTPEPFQYEGKLYSWDTVVSVHGGMGAVRFQLDNAHSRPVPVVVWRANEAGANESTVDGRLVRSLSYVGISAQASAYRTRDFIRAEIAITNRSARTIDYDAQNFTLLETAPTSIIIPRVPLKSAEMIAAALTNGRLQPGQTVMGSIYFDRDTRAKNVTLTVPVSGVTFELPLVIR